MIHRIQIISFRIFLLGLILFMLSLVRESSAQVTKQPLVKNQVIKCSEAERAGDSLDKKQQIKTLTSLYWRTFEKGAGKFPKSLLKKGIVVGDFHTKNLGLYHDPLQNNLFLMLNDLDDAGENYLIGDLVKFLIFLKRTYKKDITLKPVIEAYYKGLQNAYYPEAMGILSIRENFRRNPSKPLEKMDRKIMRAGLDQREIEKDSSKNVVRDPITQEFFKRLLEKELFQIEKSWIEVEGSGSSKDMKRFEFIVLAPSTKDLPLNNWIEFKQLKCPGAFAGQQIDLAEHFARMKNIFGNVEANPSGLLANQKTIIGYNNNFYLRRFKLPNLLNDIKEFDQNLASFYGYYLGKVHSRSTNDEYTNAVWAQTGEIEKLSKEVRKEFYNEVED